MPRVYVDTSAFLTLYQKVAETSAVERVCREARIVISRLTLLEFRSALFKQVRKNHINLKQARTVIDALRSDARKYILREESVSTWRTACSLIERHSGDRALKSLDALQLATALELPRSLSVDCFVTLDRHPLADVAESEGFEVKP